MALLAKETPSQTLEATMLRPLLALVLSAIVPFSVTAKEDARQWQVAQAADSQDQAESSDVASLAIAALQNGEF